jgi:hypothetical protein
MKYFVFAAVLLFPVICEAQRAKYVTRAPVCPPFVSYYAGGRIHHTYVPMPTPRPRTSLPATKRSPDTRVNTNYDGGTAKRDATLSVPGPQVITNPFATKKVNW